MEIQDILKQLNHLPKENLTPHKKQLQEFLKAVVMGDTQNSKKYEKTEEQKIKDVVSDLMK